MVLAFAAAPQPDAFLETLRALVGVVGLASGAAYLPQAVRIWKRKSSDDVSVLTYAFFLVGQVIWLVYGVKIGEWAVVLGMAANMVGNGAVILSALRFRSGH